MQELAIKIKIHDRQYPMKVQPKDEVYVRKATSHINHQIKSYSEQFNVIDIQDLLAMVALDCMVDHLKAQKESALTQESVEQKLASVLQLVADIT
jgi:cell division protein ZapA